jgi:dTDP-4-dehydrorhamnose reductase
MRIAVTGLNGQVATSLRERAAGAVEIVALGRPAFDLTNRDSVFAALAAAHCGAIVNAAAYTAVDKAESEPELAMRVNAEGAGFVAEAAAELGAPLLHLSTDYVFDGALDRPYREDDPTAPTGAYGRSKLAGEARIARARGDHVILRTAWVYSPFGANFVKTMLRLGETREEVGVVADQRGNPCSALDIADALITIAQRLAADPDPALRGVFHLTGQGEAAFGEATWGEATWADVAEAVFEEAARHGRPPVRVKRITTADYPTPARRPANSRLDNAKLVKTYGLSLPHWRASLKACVARLLDAPQN